MASSRKGKISELYDLAAIEKQQETVIGLVKGLVDTINQVKPVALNLQGAEKTKEIIDGMKKVSEATQQVSSISQSAVNEMGKLIDIGKKVAGANKEAASSYEQLIKASTQNAIASKELLKARKDLDAAYQGGLITLEHYTDQLGEVKKKQNEIAVSNLDINRSLRNLEKGFQSSEGSLNALRAELNLSLQAFDRLSEAEKQTNVGQDLAKKIEDITGKITEQEQATGRFQRNVGNYNASAKTIVDALDQVEKKLEGLKEKQAGLQNLSKSDPIGFKFGNNASELNQVNALIVKTEKEAQALKNITSDPKFFNLANVGSAKTEIRGFTTTLIELEQKGLGRTDFANELRKHLAELTDQVADTREEIKAMSSDSRSFDQLSSSVNFLTHTYQTFVGIQALAGDQSEETQETIKKLVAVQAVANGLQEISEQLNKRGTVVNAAYVAVQRLWATATDASAASTVRLAAATKLLLGGLLIGAIVFIVAKLIEYSNKVSEAAQATKNLGEVTAKAADKFAEASTKVNEMKTKLQLAKDGVIDKKKALEEYNTSIGKVIGQAKSLNAAEQLLIDRAPDYIQFTFLKAKAEAAAELAKESLKKSIEDSAKSGEDFLSFGDKAKSAFSSFGSFMNTIGGVFAPGISNNIKGLVAQTNYLTKTAEKNKNVAVKAEEDKYAAFSKLQEQFFKDAANFAKTHKLNFFEDNGKGDKDKNKEIEKDLQARFDLYKIEKEREINLLKTDADNKENPFASRYNALFAALDKEEKLVAEKRDFDLKAQKLTENEKKLIVAKAEDDILKLRTDAAGKLIQIQKESKDAVHDILNQRNKLNQDEANKQIDVLTNNLQKQTDEIQKAGDKQLALDLNRYSAGEIKKEEYERRKLAIENEVRRQSLLAEIDYYDKLLKLANLAPDKAAEAEKKLAALRKELNALGVKDTEDSNAKKEASDKKYHDELKSRLKELGNELKETVFSLLDSGVERQKNQIQDQINLIDERTAKEIDAANQTTLSEQDKAAKVQLINARAQAQKEALERRQRQLDEQKAKYDKAKAVIDIISSTAVAVVKTLVAYPGTPGIILAAIIGALGAAQLVRTLAQPIPKYAEGEDDHPGGLAIVGDGKKHEYVQTPDGEIYKTPATDTLVDMPKGSKVFKDQFALMNAVTNRSITTSLQIRERPNDHYQFQNVTTSIDKMRTDVVKAVKNIPQPVFDRNGLKQVIHGNGSVEQYIKGL